MLIGDEPAEGMENLMEVEIPEDVEEKLKQADLKEQEELEKEQKRREEEETKKNSDVNQKDGDKESGLTL